MVKIIKQIVAIIIMRFYFFIFFKVADIRDWSKIRRGGAGGRAGAFLFWPTSFGETLPIPGAEKS